MLNEGNNLKDSNQKSLASYGAHSSDASLAVSYKKSNKLITALFIVTDIMDKAEPLRNKLRTLGSEIISDMHTDPTKGIPKIGEVLSFLDVAEAVKLISPMNAGILKNEFLKLMESVEQYRKVKSEWIGEFLTDSPEDSYQNDSQKYSELITRRHDSSRAPTRLGVQKAGNLMDAIRGVNSPKNTSMSDRKIGSTQSSPMNFDVLKKHRRADIITALNTSEGGLTITDIKNKSKGQPDKLSALVSCGEKTLQRELVAMVKDGVLKKEGEKRWSRYSIN